MRLGGKERKEGWSRVDGGGAYGALKALEDIEWELEWEALWRRMWKVSEQWDGGYMSGVRPGLASAGERRAW